MVTTVLTKGKVVLGGPMGDKAVLQAMKTNEDDTNTAYERALGDERRQRDWMVETIRLL